MCTNQTVFFILRIIVFEHPIPFELGHVELHPREDSLTHLALFGGLILRVLAFVGANGLPPAVLLATPALVLSIYMHALRWQGMAAKEVMTEKGYFGRIYNIWMMLVHTVYPVPLAAS
ncbi:hypothetical protein DFH09DRAFT_1317497 [Mycena vulgaris]|nr:hypothetical protein DFH09DRAFT_1317497 [Mycena vulgaris]